jgi:hypothetical protein
VIEIRDILRLWLRVEDCVRWPGYRGLTATRIHLLSGACQDKCVRCCGRLPLGQSGSRSGNWMAKLLSASVQR